ncbi:MAG: mannitol-1-phosphate 5-dehydrogenase [Selenomonadaceae bacterium]|nr:mannitol-1-phosphate 5-dehydrogenase [Selenomonadaceae bacterium]
MKKAVHFGAGNIGRGFIGLLLSKAGYHVTFVDVAASLVDDINELGKYYVQIVGDEPKRILVENVSAINSDKNLDTLLDAITDADIVTTAIGPNILKFIAPNIAKGLVKRIATNDTPLNIIACENMVGGSTALKNFVYSNLPEDAKPKVDKLIGFPDAAVDRIVPLQKNEEKLLVQVEPYAEWDVDSNGIVGEAPVIEGMTLVDNLSAYIERKLFTVNTGHASIAYLSYQKGIADISSAMKNADVVEMARRVWKETGTLLIDKYGFDPDKHWKYVETTESRFANPFLSDEVTRVARGPVRKLSPKDRLVSPATQLIERGKTPEALATVIAAALKFDFNGDKEAVEVQEYIKANGMDAAITHFTGAEAGSKLFELIKAEI